MAVTAELIDRIVSEVLAQLASSTSASHAAPSTGTITPLVERVVPAVVSGAKTSSPTTMPATALTTTTPAPAVLPAPADSRTLHLQEPVITAALLSAQRPGFRQLAVGPRSIVTPAARDWLKAQKVEVTRDPSTGSTPSSPPKAAGSSSTGHAGGSLNTFRPRPTIANPLTGLSNSAQPRSSAVGAAGDGLRSNVTANGRCHLVVTTVTPAVQSLLAAQKNNPTVQSIELLGLAQEVVDHCVRLLSQAEADRIVVISEHADWITCRSNRHERVRAATVCDLEHLQSARRAIDANLICIRPAGRSFIELRQLLLSSAATSP